MRKVFKKRLAEGCQVAEVVASVNGGECLLLCFVDNKLGRQWLSTSGALSRDIASMRSCLGCNQYSATYPLTDLPRNFSPNRMRKPPIVADHIVEPQAREPCIRAAV